MPLILDDVLVNFDNKRAGIAAKVLCDFAKSGRQIFLFTCHEHICRLFLSLNVPVCALPTSNDPKRRAFRVLLPPKSKRQRKNPAETLLSVASEKADVGPNFAASNAPADVQPSIDVVGAADSGAYRTLEPGEKPAPPTPESEPETNEKTRKPYWVVEGSDEETSLKLSEDAENLRSTQGALSVGGEGQETAQKSTALSGVAAKAEPAEISEESAESESGGAEATEPSVPDFSSFVFSANAPEAAAEDAQTIDAVSDASERAAQVAEYVETLKNVALDGERVELRALSEISPTFSANETAESSLEVAPEASVVDLSAVEAEESDEEDDEEDEDAIESLDYDEWATVFLADSEARAESDDEADSEAENESFLNYFDEANDDEEEEEDWEDDEEYDDEEEFDDDVDDEAEDFDENDEFDETNDE
jgi:hypothetical protein